MDPPIAGHSFKRPHVPCEDVATPQCPTSVVHLPSATNDADKSSN